jgi:hypothetical protein
MRVRSTNSAVLVRNRSDGLTELSPKLPPLQIHERWMIITAVVLTSWGFFLAGWLPAPVLALVLTCCLAGEVVMGARALLVSLVRKPAKVIQVARFDRLRRHE